jgi:hypothetical protein
MHDALTVQDIKFLVKGLAKGGAKDIEGYHAQILRNGGSNSYSPHSQRFSI